LRRERTLNGTRPEKKGPIDAEIGQKIFFEKQTLRNDAHQPDLLYQKAAFALLFGVIRLKKIIPFACANR